MKMTKNYLFAAVTSALLLLLVFPGPERAESIPSEIATIAALSLVSIAIAGLTAEMYEFARSNKSVTQDSGVRAKRYFMSLNASLLFLVIVAPSIRAGAEGLIGDATLGVLTVFSVALAGLSSEGFFGLFCSAMGTRNRNTATEIDSAENGRDQGCGPQVTSLNSPSTTSDQQTDNLFVSSHVASRLQAVDDTLARSFQELKDQLVGAIRETSLIAPPNGETNKSTRDEIGPEAAAPQANQSTSPDQIVDALLGKPSKGAAK
jgi:hypothetical protein